MKGWARTTGAFTLVELLLTLTVMVILAAVAAPRFVNSATNYRASMGAQRLAADLALARASAKAGSASRTVVFDTSRSKVVLSGVAAMDGAGGSYTLNLTQEPFRASLVSLTFTDSVNDGQVVFDGYGVPDSGLSVNVKCGSVQRRVVLDVTTGEASVQ